jgi:GNAT superfamily N-acetyltransferase
MVEPRVIETAAGCVVVKLMDDSWILNRCVGAHPIKPQPGVVWRHDEHCARLPVPGDEFGGFMREMRETYGNCAVVAWRDDTVLGHLMFLPRAVARRWQATGWEGFGPPSDDAGTLVVANLAFCSLSGHEFRGHGVGKALVAAMLDWARENGWRRVEVYGAGGGLFPGDWLDACIPPRPFWEGRAFTVFARYGDGTISDERLKGLMDDDPRNSDEERRRKTQLVAAIRRDEIDPALYGHVRSVQAGLGGRLAGRRAGERRSAHGCVAGDGAVVEYGSACLCTPSLRAASGAIGACSSFEAGVSWG